MSQPQGEPSSDELRRRFDDLVAALVDAVLSAPRHLAAERRAAFVGEPMAGALGAFAAKVRGRAHTVTDEDVEALRREGLDEHAIFEFTIACAVGEAHSRLRAGLKALGRNA
jgi:alkylhydroperoxidase family enzyme